MANQQHLLYAIIKYLNTEKDSGKLSEDAAESLEVAAQCLETAYEVNSHDVATASRYPLPASLEDLFKAGLKVYGVTGPVEVAGVMKDKAEKLKADGRFQSPPQLVPQHVPQLVPQHVPPQVPPQVPMGWQPNEEIPFAWRALAQNQMVPNEVPNHCDLYPSMNYQQPYHQYQPCLYEQNIQMQSQNVSPPKKKRSRPSKKNKQPTERRKSQPDKWKRNVNKMNHDLGQEYCDRKGKVKKAREMGPGCEQTCRYKCHERITDEARQGIFDNFWKLGDNANKRAYIVKFVDKDVKNRVLSKAEQSRRTYSLKYYLPDDKVHRIRVCKTTFMHTHGVSDRYVNTSMRKVKSDGTVVPDLQGKHGKQRKIEESQKDTVRAHINSFSRVAPPPPFQACETEFLAANLNMSKMHQFYRDMCISQGTVPVKLYTYREIFNKEFNLKFLTPQKNI